MAKMRCPDKDQYMSKDGRCCDRCQAGSYMKAECDVTKETECVECAHGLYTATKNHMNKCHVCKVCSSNNNQSTVKGCTSREDAVCKCVTGFYCSNDKCDHCRPVSRCPVGKGVKHPANQTSDTICAACEDGTYSNVTDFHSPCRAHTRCEDIGRLLKIQGTPTTDAICGDFKCPERHWILPAGLWSGLVLTALVLFGFILWRRRRKSYRPATCSIVPVTLFDVVPPAPDSPLNLPVPPTEVNGFCQTPCTVVDCAFPVYTPDENTVDGSLQNSLESYLPTTPRKTSVSFAESSHGNGCSKYSSVNFLRTPSEPQEDEWCGT